MTDAAPAAPRTPTHLWIVGVLALLWNAVGAHGYLMIVSRDPVFMAQFTPLQVAFYDAMPAAMTSTWALSVWGGVLGSILLLLRTRFAAPVFLISLCGMVITHVRNYVFANGMEVMGEPLPLLVNVMVVVVGVSLYVYARAEARAGVLA